MIWHLTYRADRRAARIADRHYNRQKVGSAQFVPPGRCMVLIDEHATALWVTSFPFAEYVHHAWPGAWVCSCFRNESATLSSELIRDAVAATRWYCANIWNEPEPVMGMVTFVDTAKVKSSNPGCCYKKAGFVSVGKTKGGLIALQQRIDQMPLALCPNGAQQMLWEVSA
jgi:hypothetical protein